MELLRTLIERKPESAFERTGKEALEEVVAYLDCERLKYERLPVEQRKGHIWESVRVLQRELLRHRLELVQKREVNGLVQGH